ncbi:MAG: hypothetical protein ABW046_09910, partial [Actinoplanes sp.]
TSPPYATPSVSVPPITLTPSLPPGGTQPLPTLTGGVPGIPGYPTGGAPGIPGYPTGGVPGIPGYPTGGVPGYPTYPVPGATLPTTAPTTRTATPTPAHAARCTGQPTRAQILALIKGKPGMPNATLTVLDGPYCSGVWSFATVEVAGRDPDEIEPLMVVTTGKGSTLALIAAGSDVCIDRVQTEAPPGIRVLACGF